MKPLKRHYGTLGAFCEDAGRKERLLTCSHVTDHNENPQSVFVICGSNLCHVRNDYASYTLMRNVERSNCIIHVIHFCTDYSEKNRLPICMNVTRRGKLIDGAITCPLVSIIEDFKEMAGPSMDDTLESCTRDTYPEQGVLTDVEPSPVLLQNDVRLSPLPFHPNCQEAHDDMGASEDAPSSDRTDSEQTFRKEPYAGEEENVVNHDLQLHEEADSGCDSEISEEENADAEEVEDNSSGEC